MEILIVDGDTGLAWFSSLGTSPRSSSKKQVCAFVLLWESRIHIRNIVTPLQWMDIVDTVQFGARGPHSLGAGSWYLLFGCSYGGEYVLPENGLWHHRTSSGWSWTLRGRYNLVYI